MIDVFFGESRTYITDTLMQKLGWIWGMTIFWGEVGVGYKVLPGSKMAVDLDCCSGNWHETKVLERDGKYFFGLAIPGVSRGRLNGARGVVGKVENGVLVIDVRELLAPHNA